MIPNRRVVEEMHGAAPEEARLDAAEAAAQCLHEEEELVGIGLVGVDDLLALGLEKREVALDVAKVVLVFLPLQLSPSVFELRPFKSLYVKERRVGYSLPVTVEKHIVMDVCGAGTPSAASSSPFASSLDRVFRRLLVACDPSVQHGRSPPSSIVANRARGTAGTVLVR